MYNKQSTPNPMTLEVILISNPAIIKKIQELAPVIVKQIEEGWDNKVREAKTTYDNMNMFKRGWHRYVLSFFTHDPIKNKFYAIKIAEEEHGVRSIVQYHFCQLVAAKTAAVGGMYLSEQDCKKLWQEDLWSKTTKTTMRKDD